MSNKQRMTIKKCGFGSLIEMKEMVVKGKLIGYLIDNFDDTNKKLKINSSTYVINSTTFEKVIGIGDGGEPITLAKDDKFNPIRSVLLKEKSRLTVDDLVAQLVGTKTEDEMFIMRFVLLVLGTILCLTLGTHVTNFSYPCL